MPQADPLARAQFHRNRRGASRKEKAWDELSSILTDLSLLNARFDESLKLTRDIGANVSVRSQVPYKYGNAYEGGDQMLAVADAAHERLNATLDDHCERPDYSPFIEYCR